MAGGGCPRVRLWELEVVRADADDAIVTFVLVLIARVLLRPVDVGGLEGLKYRYKGLEVFANGVMRGVLFQASL